MRRITLNLATHPLRNRNFYFLLFGCLSLGIALTFFFSVRLFVLYSGKGRQAKEALAKVESSIAMAQAEEKRFSSRVQEAAKKDKEKVELVNSIILKKSFSWTEFFSLLEESLPDSSYILSLAPDLIDNSRVKMRLKVISGNLDELLLFLRNLDQLNFKDVRVESEDRSGGGPLTSEISLSYERVF